MAAKTTGGVNWLDSLGYTKPYFVPLNIPPNTNEYWVYLGGGSGSTCSMASPCNSMDDVIGKTGSSGGPMWIHVKGTGGWSWFNDNIHGSGDADCRTAACDNFIYIATWPAGSTGCATECTATINGNSNINSSNVHHVIIDGGPNLKIKFEANDGPLKYSMNFGDSTSYIFVSRTQSYCAFGNSELLFSVGNFSIASHIFFINNEFWGCGGTGDQVSALYAGAGSGGGYSDIVFENNIVRDMGGEGIEINPRATSGPLVISGNAIHNTGKVTCTTAWNCRPGITMSNQGPGAGNQNTVICSNLIWDTGSSCYWDRGAGTPVALVFNNTCYDYAKTTGGVGDANPEGFSGYSDGASGTDRNNIIYAPNGTDPFDGSGNTKTHNLCASGKSCGTSSQVWTAAGSTGTVLSTDENSPDFMVPSFSSVTRNRGFDVSGTCTLDYRGNPIKSNTGQSAIGAIRYAPSTPDFGRF